MTNDEHEPGVEQNERALRHREAAVALMHDGEPAIAVVHALLAVEARLDELAVWLARLG